MDYKEKDHKILHIPKILMNKHHHLINNSNRILTSSMIVKECILEEGVKL